MKFDCPHCSQALTGEASLAAWKRAVTSAAAAATWS